MPARRSSTRPPLGFVPVSITSWQALCATLQKNGRALEVHRGDQLVGWRAPNLFYVDPDAYRAIVGGWPPGHFPG